MTRSLCEDCDQYAFVLDNVFQCCDRRVTPEGLLLESLNFAIQRAKALMGVYRFRNVVTGRIYIGQSSSLLDRIQAHRKAIRGLKHDIAAVNEDAKAHGPDSFEFEVLFLVDKAEDLLEEEGWTIAKFRSLGSTLYNRHVKDFETKEREEPVWAVLHESAGRKARKQQAKEAIARHNENKARWRAEFEASKIKSSRG